MSPTPEQTCQSNEVETTVSPLHSAQHTSVHTHEEQPQEHVTVAHHLVTSSATASTLGSTDHIQKTNEKPKLHPSFSKFSYRAASFFLTNAAATGELGTGPVETNAVDTNIVATIFQTMPWGLLFVELLWSLIVTAIAYRLGNKNSPDGLSTLSVEFWTTRINVPSSITFTLGWALFVLLGFFIREASNRYQEGQYAIHSAGCFLRQVIRILQQLYPAGTWHEGDMDRVVAHIVAYPIALKMTLRSERERAQLDQLLHEDDVTDVLNANVMHIHCSRVVRAYFSASEIDASHATNFSNVSKAPAGPATGYFAIDILDAVDLAANTAVRIAEFRPAVVYVNHLRFFLYIWLMFLPLSLVQTSGWFTTLWSVLIAYSVSMLFIIAKALNEPYGFDAQDVKLNRLCAEYAHDCLIDYTSARMHLNGLLDPKHDTPSWLELDACEDESDEELMCEEANGPSDGETPPSFQQRLHRCTIGKLMQMFQKIRIRPISMPVALATFFVVVWNLIIVFSTWGESRGDERSPGTRWWATYIPIDTSTTRFVSLAVFLLLSFWVDDAYDRYWHALHLWKSQIHSSIEEVAFQLALLCPRGIWHDRDRERIFSHLAALPFASKVSLRESRDLTDLRPMLSPKDIQAIADAPSLDMHILSVIYGYINGADAKHETFRAEAHPFSAAAFTMLYKLWSIENALNECRAMRRFPLSPAFSAHLLAFTFFWLALLPLVLVVHDGFVSFVYIIPIAYSITNFVKIGRELTDPFGFEEDDIPLDSICDEMKCSVHRIYQDTLVGPKGYIVQSEYTREAFRAGDRDSEDIISEGSDTEEVEPEQIGISATRKVFRMIGIGIRVIYVEIIEVINLIPFVSIKVPIEGQSANPMMMALKSSGMKLIYLISFPFLKLLDFARAVKARIQSSSDKNRADEEFESNEPVTIHMTIIRTFRSLPSVSIIALLAATAWCLVAVGVSYGISRAWDGDRQDRCSKWCSAIDVEPKMLATVGFALFLILTLRASNAIYRYEDGAVLISNLQMHLRNLSIEVVQSFRDGCFHEGDKERIVAHLVQIPLCFRDMLLGIQRKTARDKEGLLTDEDRTRFENSMLPIEHLLNTVEAYFLVQDGEGRQEIMKQPMKVSDAITRTIIDRVASVREMISRALVVKRYPVIACYTRHQHFFTGLWIALLPLSMTAHTGFLTMLWAPLISYGVLSLESIVGQLVDPYGHDAIDIPVNALCKRASEAIVDAVRSVNWESEYHTRESLPDSEGRIGSALEGNHILNTYSLAHGSDDEDRGAIVEQTDSDSTAIRIGGPREPKRNPTLLAHLKRSIHWWVLFAVMGWTILACVISSVWIPSSARDEDAPQQRWWISEISVSSSAATYVSFATFVILGFFVQAALARYTMAGSMWGDSLRSSCHTLTSLFLSLAPRNAMHQGDHERVVGHIAALPLVLKAELRDSRDIREVKGLLSLSDVSRIEFAESMAGHCLDVIRSYVFKVTCREELIVGNRIKPRHRASFIMKEIIEVEQLVRTSQSIHSFRLAPGFTNLLKALLVLWHAMVPFAIIEHSGWFTILWIAMVSFGILGLYNIGIEMQDPYGSDDNDLDVDKFADEIVMDVIRLYRGKRTGWACDIKEISTSDDWGLYSNETAIESRKHLFADHDKLSTKELIVEALNFGRFAITRKMMVGTVAWTIVSVGVAYAISKHLPLDIGNLGCSPWFCSGIAIEDSLKEYVGLALFLLLGYRLYDSHFRYVAALRIWQDGIIGRVRLFTNRLFESYNGGCWHDGDLERICGHIAAFSICLMGALRSHDYQERLRRVLGEEDVQRILQTSQRQRMDHCIDVIRAYLIDGERMEQEDDEVHPCGSNEHRALFYYLRELGRTSVACQNMVKVPLPFGYVQQLRILLMIWIILLPLGLVERTGWLTILWIIFIVYAVVGIETWADRLSDPFGLDFTDVPLERMNDHVVSIVKANLHLFNFGMESVIRANRCGFIVDSNHALSVKSPFQRLPPTKTLEDA